jgi:magnesium transporter
MGAIVLNFHSCRANGDVQVNLDDLKIPAGINWIDAMKPEPQELKFLEAALGVDLPDFDDLSEIESTSRLYVKNGYLFLTMPAIYKNTAQLARLTPFGMILSKNLLLTFRFKNLALIKSFVGQIERERVQSSDGPETLIAIFEAIVDHIADMLEGLSTDLELTSQQIFGTDEEGAKKRRWTSSGDHMSELLRNIGRAGDLTGKISESLLGMGRIIPYVTSHADLYLSDSARARFDGLRRDIVSLNEFETRLTDKAQFLLDSSLGLINIEQNNVFRLLTGVSIVGIPPTFVASMYGMNFKNMPELEWAYGYEYALVLIFITALIPFIWFKTKGWL